jgi:hypothetical protein
MKGSEGRLPPNAQHTAFRSKSLLKKHCLFVQLSAQISLKYATLLTFDYQLVNKV